MVLGGIDVCQCGSALAHFPGAIRNENSVLAIPIEKMQFTEEAKLIPVPDVCIILVHGPEEAIIATFVSSVEAIAQMNTQGVVSRIKMARHIVRGKLDAAVVIGPAWIKPMVRSRLAIDRHIEVTESRREQDSPNRLLGQLKGLPEVNGLVPSVADLNRFPAICLVLEPRLENQTAVRHICLVHTVWC